MSTLSHFFQMKKLSLREVCISQLLKVLVQASGTSGFHPGLSDVKFLIL